MLAARTQASKYDFDGAAGLKSGKQNEVSGKIHNSDRLSHVQNKGLSAAAHRESLRDEFGGFLVSQRRSSRHGYYGTALVRFHKGGGAVCLFD
jgi:hypothetical protein